MPPPYNRKAFTLSEVLITLVIIGIISAITVPTINTSIRKKVLESQTKKVYSTIVNALNKVQLEEGMIGDNSATFTGESWSCVEPANKLAKQLDTIVVCHTSEDTNPQCKDLNKYSFTKKDTLTEFTAPTHSKILLSDGSILIVDARICGQVLYLDEKDAEGNVIGQIKSIQPCGFIYFDVNGLKAPNKGGEDVFHIIVQKDKVNVYGSEWVGNTTLQGTIMNNT